MIRRRPIRFLLNRHKAARSSDTWPNPALVTVLAIAAGLIVLSCSGIDQRVYRSSDTRLARVGAVAVLPFTNYTTYPSAGEIVSELFSTGLFASNMRLKIVERAEVTRSIGVDQNVDIPVYDRRQAVKIGRELGVDAVFIGSVTEYVYRNPSSKIEENPAISVHARLVEVSSGDVIWAGSFNGGATGAVSLCSQTQLIVSRAMDSLAEGRQVRQ